MPLWAALRGVQNVWRFERNLPIDFFQNEDETHGPTINNKEEITPMAFQKPPVSG